MPAGAACLRGVIEFRGSERKARAKHWMTARMATIFAAAVAATAWIDTVTPDRRLAPVVAVLGLLAVAATGTLRWREAARARDARVTVDRCGVTTGGTRIAWADLKFHALFGDRLVLSTTEGPVDVPDEFEVTLEEIRRELSRRAPCPEVEALMRREERGRAIVRDHGWRLVWPGAAGAMAVVWAAILGWVAWKCARAGVYVVPAAAGSGILAAVGLGSIAAWPPRQVRTRTVVGPEFIVSIGPRPFVLWRGAIQSVSRVPRGPRPGLALRSRNGHVEVLEDLDLEAALSTA